MLSIRSLLALSMVPFFAACTAAPTTAPPAQPPAATSSPSSSPTVAVLQTAAPAGSPTAGSSPSASPRPATAGVTSDAEAIQELEAVRQGYEQAQIALQAGRRDEALNLLNSAYLDHFDRTEPWLDQRFGQDYRTGVEAAVSREVRGRLRNGAPETEVLAQLPNAFARIQEAEQRLRGG